MNSATTSSIFRPSVHSGCMPFRAVSGRNIAPAMSRWKSRNAARDLISGCGGGGVVFEELRGFESFMVDFVKRRNAVIPFEQRGGVAAELDGVGVHFPHRIEHRVVVGVEDVFLELRMAGDVDLPHAVVRE